MKINKSLSNNIWLEKVIDKILLKIITNKINSPTFSKLLVSRGIDENNIENFLKPNISSDIPNHLI